MSAAPTDHVVVVGAGLAGLSAAMHLAGAGRKVTLLERESAPGGRAARVVRPATGGGDYHLDTGPTVLTMPDLFADCFAAIGQELGDWVELLPAGPGLPRPVRRRQQPVPHLGPRRHDRRGSGSSSGPSDADGYRRYVEFVSKLYRLQMREFIDRNFSSPLDLAGPSLARLVAMRGFSPAGADGRPLLPRRAAPEGLQLPGHVRRGVPAAGARDLRGHLLHGPGRGRLLPRRRHERAAHRDGRRGERGRASTSATTPRSARCAGRASGSARCSPPTGAAGPRDAARAHPGHARGPRAARPALPPSRRRPASPPAAWSCRPGCRRPTPTRRTTRWSSAARGPRCSRTSSRAGSCATRRSSCPCPRRPTRAWPPRGAARRTSCSPPPT